MARTFHHTEPLDTRRKAGRPERTASPQPEEEVLVISCGMVGIWNSEVRFGKLSVYKTYLSYMSVHQNKTNCGYHFVSHLKTHD